MLFYILLLLFLLFSYMLTRKVYIKKKWNVFLIISFISLLLLYTFRGISVGWDTYVYVDIFTHANEIDLLHHYMELGWLVFIKTLYLISSDPRLYFFGTGLIGLGLFYFVAKRLSVNPSFSVIMYYMFGNWFNLMNQVRCQIAVCICIVSFYFIYRMKYLSALLTVFIASLIHDSAIVFLVFIVVNAFVKKISWKTLLLFVSGVALVLLFYDYLYEHITLFYYTSYTTEARLISHTKPGNLKVFTALAIILVWIALIQTSICRVGPFLCKDNLIKLYAFDDKTNSELLSVNKLSKMLYLTAFMSLSILIISVKNTMIGRFANYFIVYYSFLIPNVYQLLKRRERRIAILVLSIIMFLYFIMYVKYSENGMGRDGVIPYVFYESK